VAFFAFIATELLAWFKAIDYTMGGRIASAASLATRRMFGAGEFLLHGRKRGKTIALFSVKSKHGRWMPAVPLSIPARITTSRHGTPRELAL